MVPCEMLGLQEWEVEDKWKTGGEYSVRMGSGYTGDSMYTCDIIDSEWWAPSRNDICVLHTQGGYQFLQFFCVTGTCLLWALFKAAI